MTVAMHEYFERQVALVAEFVDAAKRILSDPAHPTHKYTTLKDTQRYLKR